MTMKLLMSGGIRKKKMTTAIMQMSAWFVGKSEENGERRQIDIRIDAKVSGNCRNREVLPNGLKSTIQVAIRTKL